MHRCLRFNAVSMIMGLMAMILCGSTPAAAETMMSHPATGAVSANEMPEMPCCPEKAPAVYKACGLQCPVIAPASYDFVVVMKTDALTFTVNSAHYGGITFGPRAPPPR
ncbi:hypothetical protein [Asticcacaulis sp. YBE204]|uniref:hypothetical protein n=1 Tax=Asticcacaulis sp. YBE204 TaxID=1282363 RepID=UPI0003C3C6A4|nr:hypothetical protein [Asticcacaulis sp. YBE204]ESQ78699.1 hypothetical protein AEYBE204_11990 [Asticcacaulis sp. YBE204]